MDIRPMYRALGGSPDRRMYFPLIGHFKDPVKFANPFRLGDNVKAKGSVLTRLVYDFLSGSDWAGRRFTTLSKLLGIDDKGEYKTTRAGHYRRGDPKGGKLAGSTVAHWRGGGRPVGLATLPSYTLYEGRQTLPIWGQQAVAFLQGETDALTAMLRAGGFRVATMHGEAGGGDVGEGERTRQGR